jgi:hypothetical protein
MSAARSAYLFSGTVVCWLAACNSGGTGDPSSAAVSSAASGGAGAAAAAVGGAGAGASAGAVAVAGSAANTPLAAGAPPSMGNAGGGAGGRTAGSVAAAGGAAAGGGATFTEVFNLLAGGCATGGYCHAAGGGTSKLALVDQASAYTALAGVAGMGMAAPGSGKMGCSTSMIVRVKAGDPDNSLLMQKLEGKQTCGDVMPPGGMLLPAELKLVRDWITAGAQND